MSRRSTTTSVSTLQPDLFAFGVLPQGANVLRDRDAKHVEAKVPEFVSSATANPSASSTSMPTHGATRPAAARALPAMRVVSLADLPQYPELDQELVDRSIAALPPNRIWFTYAAIKECFGVSRATVARKVKRGLVPGIRFRGASVLEDGPVRRFDRSQLRWLLLALRSR